MTFIAQLLFSFFRSKYAWGYLQNNLLIESATAKSSWGISRKQSQTHRGWKRKNEKNTNSSSFASAAAHFCLAHWAKNNKLGEQWRARRGFARQARFATSRRHSLTLASSYGFSAFASWSRGGESPQTRAGRGGWGGEGMHGQQPLSPLTSQWPRAAAERVLAIGMCTLSLPEHHQQRPWGHGGGQGWRGAGQLLVKPLAQPPVHPLQPHVRQVSTHTLSLSLALSPRAVFLPPRSRTLIFGS